MLAQDYSPAAARSESRRLGKDFIPLQRVWLSRGLVALCLWRLEQILRHCNPSDHPLAAFLKTQITAEGESFETLKTLDLTLPRSGRVEFCSGKFDQLLSKFLPSAFNRFGEGFMDRDAALHFVEVLDSERQSFFFQILDGLSGNPPRDCLRVESEQGTDRLRLVRTILLPPMPR